MSPELKSSATAIRSREEANDISIIIEKVGHALHRGQVTVTSGKSGSYRI